VVGLIAFHSARFFMPIDFYVQGDESIPFMVFGLMTGLWGMPLLFVASGVGIWHALAKREPMFGRERFLGLIVPFVVDGVLIVAATAVH
jgi:hypothetical protein